MLGQNTFAAEHEAVVPAHSGDENNWPADIVHWPTCNALRRPQRAIRSNVQSLCMLTTSSWPNPLSDFKSQCRLSSTL